MGLQIRRMQICENATESNGFEIHHVPREIMKTGTNPYSWAQVPNEPTRWDFFWKLTLTRAPDPIQLGGGAISGRNSFCTVHTPH